MSNIKIEFRKSICNIYFISICTLCSMLSLIYLVKTVRLYSDYRAHISFEEVLSQNTLAPTFSAYTMWIGGPRLENDKTSKLFFWVILLATSIPYAWSYCSEVKKARSNKKTPSCGFSYMFSKYLAVFISSGLIAAIPLIINLLGIMLFVPITSPDPVYDIYFREFSSSILGNLYYVHPIFYECIYVAVIFIFCGALGCLGYAVSSVVRSRIIAVSTAPALLMAIYFAKEKLPVKYGILSPLDFMNVADVMFRNYKILFIEIVIMLLVSIVLVSVRIMIDKKTERSHET